MNISTRIRDLYLNHGWSEEDLNIFENLDHIWITEGTNWAMIKTISEDKVVWLYPVAQDNDFPKSLWKAIKKEIKQNPDGVAIPMSKNMEKVEDAGKRYNGFLLDNFLVGEKEFSLYVFNDIAEKMKSIIKEKK